MASIGPSESGRGASREASDPSRETEDRGEDECVKKLRRWVISGGEQRKPKKNSEGSEFESS